MHWRGTWQPTPVFLPGESQGLGTWWAAVYGVGQSRTRLKRLSSSSSSSSSNAPIQLHLYQLAQGTLQWTTQQFLCFPCSHSLCSSPADIYLTTVFRKSFSRRLRGWNRGSSPTESKRLFHTSVSLLLSRIHGYCYHLSKFRIYV